MAMDTARIAAATGPKKRREEAPRRRTKIDMEEEINKPSQDDDNVSIYLFSAHILFYLSSSFGPCFRCYTTHIFHFLSCNLFLFFCSSLRRASLFSFSVCLFRNRDYDRRIYHLVSSAEIKVSWEQLIDCGRWIICNRLPLNGVLWYPGGSMKSSRLHHNICCILYHWIPAIILDCLLFCLRYPPV